MILPGSKNVIGDLTHLKQQGWPEKINRHLRYGGKLLGVCGGFQMLGQTINDPQGIESNQLSIDGLGFADFSTELTENKQLKQIQGQSCFSETIADFKGYEIHCGESSGKALNTPAFEISSGDQKQKRYEGFISADNQIMGTYIHGLFDSSEMNKAIFDWINPKHNINQGFDLDAHRERQLNQLANTLTTHLDIEKIKQILGITA